MGFGGLGFSKGLGIRDIGFRIGDTVFTAQGSTLASLQGAYVIVPEGPYILLLFRSPKLKTMGLQRWNDQRSVNALESTVVV